MVTNNWNVLVESTADGTATVLEVSDCQVTDETKQGAVEKVQQLLRERLAKGEIITVPVQVKLFEENSLMKFAGIFQDDPDFSEIMKELSEERENSSNLWVSGFSILATLHYFSTEIS
jgi:uncharacterized protein YoaH (UPF0181 family)